MKTNHALGDFLSLAGFQPQGERWIPVPRTHLSVAAGSGGTLTLRVPWISEALFDCWLGPRLVWWSSELVERGTVSVVSSRISRAWDEQPEWFAGWRAIGRELLETGERLLLVTATSTARFGRHVAERMGVPYVEVTVASDQLTVASWLRNLSCPAETTVPENPVPEDLLPEELVPEDLVGQSPATLRLQCELSPVLPPELTASLKWLIPESIRGSERSLPDRAIPVADRALVLLGHRLLTLSVRPGGHVEQLLQARELQREYWHGWTPPPTRCGAADHISSAALPSSAMSVSWLTLEQVEQIPLLCHCTRRHDGRWEDQSEEEYFDELLWERPAKDRSALAVLSRILTTHRLAASSLAIRGGYRVIGFTARKLAELSAARVYQRHRRRWDFEPYGLAIRQDWLQQRGARPVEYGDDRDWQRLDETQRPFFQPRGELLAAAPARTAAATADTATIFAARWTQEQEWRLLGDLDLRDLPAEAAFILVGDVSDVSRLPGNLRWPVVVLPSSGRLLNQ